MEMAPVAILPLNYLLAWSRAYPFIHSRRASRAPSCGSANKCLDDKRLGYVLAYNMFACICLSLF